jgi:hypothetical protein
VCNADARDHRRVAKDGWRADEVVEESNSGAKKNRRDVDADFVEEAGIQALLDSVGGRTPRVWNSTSPEFMYQSNTSATPSLRSAT